MRFSHTTGSNPDFKDLCALLDESLNEIAGGEENRKEYIEYNSLEDIGDVIIAYIDDKPIACAGFKHIEDGVAEVKRVFVKREHQGKGISKTIMRQLEDKALEKCYKELILETGKGMDVAIGLYTSLGYKVIPNYGQYKDMIKSVCMKKVF